jgi:hypothetical protein
MAVPGTLAPGVRSAIGLAVRPLPTREARNRYLDEFIGDLYGLSTAQQLRYAAGVVSQAFALRTALRADPSHLAEPLHGRARWRWFRCHVLRKHYYRTYSTDDGSRYRACEVCHQEDPGDWSGGGPGYLAPLSTSFGQMGGGGTA